MPSSPVSPEESNAIVNAVIERLRKETGREPDTETIVDTLIQITVHFYQKGEYLRAERMAYTALDIAEQDLGKEHQGTLASLSNLAVLYQFQNHYDKAEPFYQRALAISKLVPGKEHPKTLTTQLNLAVNHINNQKIPLALQELRQMDTHPARLRWHTARQYPV
uniref:Tetratricopeptide repeat-containing protein n=1 Tax=Candidatus Kentrum sp. UNK TaxID=2126344 RepID=A0A451B1G5_9GAMM|nr:MAG: Tetratricopeptide repeat-containing protein [Candidatus Kentron sp. UNK]VFK72097.1 MAG: Tetratricopeptide repeat-containing protein [Candidatus Kentron sp. UNK]